MIYQDISNLVTYAIQTGLMTEDDRGYAVNELLELLKLDEYEALQKTVSDICLEETLNNILD